MRLLVPNRNSCGAESPGEVVVEQDPCSPPTLNPGIIEPTESCERRPSTVALEHNRKRREGLLEICRPEQTFVPGECRVEVIYHPPRKDMSVACRERKERLRG